MVFSNLILHIISRVGFLNGINHLADIILVVTNVGAFRMSAVIVACSRLNPECLQFAFAFSYDRVFPRFNPMCLASLYQQIGCSFRSMDPIWLAT